MSSGLEDAREALSAAVDLWGSQPGAATTCVVTGSSLEVAVPARVAFTAEVAEDIAADVVAHAGQWADKELLAYDPAVRPSRAQIMVEGISDVPALHAVDQQVRADDIPFGDQGEKSVALAHTVGTGPDAVVAYRLRGVGLTVRPPRWQVFVSHGGRYEKAPDDILFYEPSFQAITFRGWVFFASPSDLQGKLEAPAKAKRMARSTLRTAVRHVTIAGFDRLEEAVADDPTMRSKMASLARILDRDPEYAQYLTTEKLVSFVQAHPEYDIATAELDGETVLAFDPHAQKRHQIPKLLTDDFLQSTLTGRSYEAGSKHRYTND